jgi:hypothetical protein
LIFHGIRRADLIKGDRHAALIYKGEGNYNIYSTNTSVRDQVFGKIFRENEWKDRESVSGHGSTLYNTTIIRKALPKLLKQYAVVRFLDAPCGDFNWMRHVDMPNNVEYLGCDIVIDLIKNLAGTYANQNRSFKVLESPIGDQETPRL